MLFPIKIKPDMKELGKIIPEDLVYTGCHKYIPIDQCLNFRAHRGYNLKRSTARCAKIKELDLATLGTQTAKVLPSILIFMTVMKEGI